MAVYPLGTLVKCSCVIRDKETGELVDPTALVFKYKDPANVTTTKTYGTDPEVVRTSQGKYYVVVDGNQSGNWEFRFESSGIGQGAKEDSFIIETTEF